MLAPSLLSSADFYSTPVSEKSMPSKKRLSSPTRHMVDGLDKHTPTAPVLERRISDITSDISLDNLLEGSRRKRNRFSSDLPLVPLPLPTPPNAPYSLGHARSHSGARDRADSGSTSGNVYQTPGRVSIPTPAPTTISDEDVAIQLIRLGDPSLSPCKAQSSESSSPIPNLSTVMQLKELHDGCDRIGEGPREVDYPSSPPASVSDDGEPARKRRTSAAITSKSEYSLDDDMPVRKSLVVKNPREGLESQVKDETDVEEELEIEIPRPQNLPHFHDSMQQCNSMGTDSQSLTEDERSKKRNSGGPSVGIRCTRCKKSKKGCDRQRPCGRCADANEDCVTEDESSNRRGRNNRGGRRKR